MNIPSTSYGLALSEAELALVVGMAVDDAEATTRNQDLAEQVGEMSPEELDAFLLIQARRLIRRGLVNFAIIGGGFVFLASVIVWSSLP